jgi:F0F1-type ATP synthase assembly protein I
MCESENRAASLKVGAKQRHTPARALTTSPWLMAVLLIIALACMIIIYTRIEEGEKKQEQNEEQKVTSE